MTETTRKPALTEAERLHERLRRVRTKQERNRGRKATLEAELTEVNAVGDSLAQDATALLAALAVLEPETDDQVPTDGS